jgi:hypothetical protein
MRLPWAVAIFAVLGVAAAGAAAEDTARAKAAAERHVAAREASIVAELRGLLALPNVATNEADIRGNAARLVKLLQLRGVDSRMLETPGAPVAVFGERKVEGATRTLLLY